MARVFGVMIRVWRDWGSREYKDATAGAQGLADFPLQGGGDGLIDHILESTADIELVFAEANNKLADEELKAEDAEDGCRHGNERRRDECHFGDATRVDEEG